MRIEPVVYPIVGTIAGMLISWLAKDEEPYRDMAEGLIIGSLAGYIAEVRQDCNGTL